MSNKQLIIVSLETFNNRFSFTLKPQAVFLFSVSTQAFTFTYTNTQTPDCISEAAVGSDEEFKADFSLDGCAR